MTGLVPPLRRVRERTGLSLRDVAHRARVDPGQLSRIERGLQRPTIPFLIAVGDALGLEDLVATLERFWPEERT